MPAVRTDTERANEDLGGEIFAAIAGPRELHDSLTASPLAVSCSVLMADDLSQRAVLVLTSLAGGPKHGYSLIKDIEQFAGVKLGPGTLYGVLARLEECGLIRALPSEGRRYPYEVTAAGTGALTARLVSDGQIAKVGLERIGLQPA